MSMILMDTGATQIAKSYFKKTNPAGGSNLTVKLFVNNVTPADTDTAATYTEADGGGYVSKTLLSTAFTISTVSGIVQAAYAQQQFVFTGPLTGTATIYGIYIVDADGVLIFAEKAVAPYTPSASGDMYIVNLVWKMSTGTVS